MKILKDLTPQECIEIASIIKSDVNWKFIQSKERSWEGFDLVENTDLNNNKYILQIDYKRREFRLYDESLTIRYIPLEILEKVYQYLDSIDNTKTNYNISKNKNFNNMKIKTKVEFTKKELIEFICKNVGIDPATAKLDINADTSGREAVSNIVLTVEGAPINQTNYNIWSLER